MLPFPIKICTVEIFTRATPDSSQKYKVSSSYLVFDSVEFEPCLQLEAFWWDVWQCWAPWELVEVDHFLLKVLLVDCRWGRGSWLFNLLLLFSLLLLLFSLQMKGSVGISWDLFLSAQCNLWVGLILKKLNSIQCVSKNQIHRIVNENCSSHLFKSKSDLTSNTTFCHCFLHGILFTHFVWSFSSKHHMKRSFSLVIEHIQAVTKWFLGITLGSHHV